MKSLFQIMIMNIRQRKIKIERVWKILHQENFEPQQIYVMYDFFLW